MTQRNLRRFGYMTKSGKGWTRFSIEETAWLLILGKLLEMGVALAESDDLIRRSKNAGLMVTAFAFDCPAPYSTQTTLRAARSR
jgi:hypothetical protein